MRRYAYADPPYPGQARRHYRNDPSKIHAAEVGHAALIAQLERDYPDGWALSTSSSALRDVLALCPPDVRIAAWVKPFASFKPGVNPAYAWEPVIWRGGRKRGRHEPTVRDWVSANITLKRGTHGAKPEAFCFWLFDLLGLQCGDMFYDLYPGSRAVGAAWERYQMQLWTA
jgi:hypothetical protein